MRGKVANVLLKIPVVGITPAYAGKSIFCHFIFKLLKDHPRLCGEKIYVGVVPISCLGSPPPMRGKEFANDLIPAEVRITPAYAGKRSNFIPLLGNLQDHPRLCGEKPINWAGKFDNVGSPPPMRGKAHKSSGTAFLIRITPAYAGKRCNIQFRTHF